MTTETAAAAARRDAGDRGEHRQRQRAERADPTEEGEALQTLVDDQINPEVDYVVEIEASDEFEEQFQIRAEGGDARRHH